jgi:large subunit ribosomal protein L17
MASSLILHKRITTTVAKAKALRVYVEPLLTKSKSDSTHSRRVIFSYLQDKNTMKELFGEVANKIANRPGGYTRILKTGNRLGDNSDMCIIELVDYNDDYQKGTATRTKATRTRRGKSKAADTTAAASATETSSEAPKAKKPRAKKTEEKAQDDDNASTEASDKE